MAKMTLLEIVQNILSSMDSDEVNSVGDTVESLQVAEVVKETYYDITTGIDIPGLHSKIKLDASLDIARPNIMYLPSDVLKIEWVRYNGKEVEYKDPEWFIRYVLRRGTDSDTIQVIDGLNILNNIDPIYYTSFDDQTLTFDAWDNAADTTLQQSKSLCWGQLDNSFEFSDTFIPLLPVDMFPRLLAESKATCFVNFKQTANSKEESKARRQAVRQQNNRRRAGELRPIDRLPNYGRRR